MSLINSQIFSDNKETLKELVEKEDARKFPTTKEEILTYLKEFSVNFHEQGKSEVRTIQCIKNIGFSTYLNSSFQLTAIDIFGNEGDFEFISSFFPKNENEESFHHVSILWNYFN